VNLSTVFERNRPDPPIVFRTALSLHDISANLRARANDWRDSAVPAELRAIGVTKLILEEKGGELSIEWGGRTSPVNNPACFLTVVRIPGGGSEVTARFGRGTLRVFAVLLLLSTPLQAIGHEDSPLRWFFVAASVAVSLSFLITGRSTTPILMSHLLQIVQEATRAPSKPEKGAFSRAAPIERM
jgi:hypothetical protein